MRTLAGAGRLAPEFVVPSDPALAGRSLLIVDDRDQLPAGTPATAEEASAAQAFAEPYTACQNTGALRRLLTGLYTDAMFQSARANRLPLPFQPQNPLEALYALLFDPNGKDAAEAQAQLAQDILAPPTPLSPPIAAAEVRDVRVLPDGRVGAILVQDSRPTEFQMYARVDGRLRLDERMNFGYVACPHRVIPILIRRSISAVGRVRSPAPRSFACGLRMTPVVGCWTQHDAGLGARFSARMAPFQIRAVAGIST